MKYIRNFSAHTNYEGEMSKIPTPSVSYCRKENECHFMPSNVIMFKVGELNGNTNQTVTVNYYEGGSETIPITEGNKWYVVNIPSGKSLQNFDGIKEITDTIISAKIKNPYGTIINNIRGNLTFIACDTSELTSINGAFRYCKLTSIDTSGLDTSKVTNMVSLFESAYSLKTFSLTNFNTAKVTDLRYMFRHCESLETIDLSNFNTAIVTNMAGMFDNCSSLVVLDLSSFNTENVTSMSSMFVWCTKLQELNISGWDLTNTTKTDDMFAVCSSLKTIYMRGCNQTTIDKIKAQLETDGILNNVTIITE